MFRYPRVINNRSLVVDIQVVRRHIDRLGFETLITCIQGNNFIPFRVIDEAARCNGHALSFDPEQNAGERYSVLEK